MDFSFVDFDMRDVNEFDPIENDISRLEIRPAADSPHLLCFYDPVNSRLVTSFILEDAKFVRTLMDVKLTNSGGTLHARVRLWKRKKPSGEVVSEDIPDIPATRALKASVGVDGGYAAFWIVIAFIQALPGVELPESSFKLVTLDDNELAELLAKQDKSSVLAAMRLSIGDGLTQADINMLTNRRDQLDEFHRLLSDSKYFAEQRKKSHSPEAVWQRFFERNQWIFGYGLTFVACESLSDDKLERITTGAGVFTGAGKRADAAMRTRGYLSSLLFGEIKTHETELLAANAYRPPDVYRPSLELIGAVAQIQKTADKAVHNLQQRLHKVADSSGSPTGIEVLTVRPRQILIIGHLRQLEETHGINEEKAHSFELFRRSVQGLEILTFDELYERAKFIVQEVETSPASDQVEL